MKSWMGYGLKRAHNGTHLTQVRLPRNYKLNIDEHLQLRVEDPQDELRQYNGKKVAIISFDQGKTFAKFTDASVATDDPFLNAVKHGKCHLGWTKLFVLTSFDIIYILVSAIENWFPVLFSLCMCPRSI